MKGTLRDRLKQANVSDLQFLQGLNNLSGEEFQKKVNLIFKDVLWYQNSKDDDIRNLSHQILTKINAKILSKHLLYIIGCLDGDILLSSFQFQDICRELSKMIPSQYLAKYFNLFIDAQKRDNQYSELCNDLALKIPPCAYEDKFEYLMDICVKCSKKDYCPEKYLCRDLIKKLSPQIYVRSLKYIIAILKECRFLWDQGIVNICESIYNKIPGEYLSEHLSYLIDYIITPQKSETGCGYDKEFCQNLLLKASEKDLVNELERIINFQKSEDEKIVKLSFDIVMKIPINLLKSKESIIVNGLKSENTKVLELCQKLALKIGDTNYLKDISKKIKSILDVI